MIHFWITFLPILPIVVANPAQMQYARTTNNTSIRMAFNFAEIPITPDIQWTPCFKNYTCMNLQVPLHYANLSAGNTHIAFMKLAATTQPAKGDILLNAGRARQFRREPADLDPNDGDSRRDFWLKVGGLSEWCSKTRDDDAIRYINTPAIAHDMLYYSEKLAEFHDERPSESLVNYYGVSYGTILGSTFAKLFPHLLGRFILAGVADIEDYYSGAWTTGILQADEAIDSFFEHCIEAGPKCRFYQNNTSIADMRNRVDAILSDIEENPIVVTDPELVQYPTVMKTADLQGTLYTQLYEFISGFPGHCSGGNKGKIPSEGIRVGEHSPALSRMAITCNDMNGRYNISSPEMFRKYIERQKTVSKYFGETWASLMTVRCWIWQISPMESQTFPAVFEMTQTNKPILLTGNVIDPFTSSPFIMAAFFPGSHVMLQDGAGHGVPGIPSACTSAHIQHFVETGQLPPNNTICPVDLRPFERPLA